LRHMAPTSGSVVRRIQPDKSFDPRGREQPGLGLMAAAEGATAPETLRQKGPRE
jgi:hypothetical protein